MNYWFFCVYIQTINIPNSCCRWKYLIVDDVTPPQERQILAFRGVNLGTKRVLPLPYWDYVTKFHWGDLGPFKFSDYDTFESKEALVEEFGQINDSKQIVDLHTVLRTYHLWIVKEDAEKYLPPNEETLLKVALKPIQNTYYKEIYEKKTYFLFKGTKSGNANRLMNVMMELRKCCNKLFLIHGAEVRVLDYSASSGTHK